jgi:multiple sugar transport system permease protein
MALAWDILLHPTIGPLNELLRSVGLQPHNWLRDRDLVLPTFMVIGVWQNLGLAIVLFIGGLAGIPRDLYEAAEVDGATSSLDRFLTVTLPGIGPVAVFVMTTMVLRGLELFDMPRVLTHGGPGYESESLLHTLFVESFVYLRTGFGAALTVIFLALALALTLFRRQLDKRVHYA